MSVGSERRQEYVDLSLDSLKDTYRRFEIYIKALDTLVGDYETFDILRKHIIKTNGKISFFIFAKNIIMS